MPQLTSVHVCLQGALQGAERDELWNSQKQTLAAMEAAEKASTESPAAGSWKAKAEFVLQDEALSLQKKFSEQGAACFVGEEISGGFFKLR